MKLHSDNVRLIARMKGEAPSITVAMLVSQLKHYSVDGRGQEISYQTYELPTCRIPKPNNLSVQTFVAQKFNAHAF